MKFIMQRALFYTFATREIEGSAAIEVWHTVGNFFGISPEEEKRGEKLLSNPVLANLNTAEDIRLLQKCAEGFGKVFKLSADEAEGAELKYQALFKLKQLAGEMRATPLKAVASAYRRDPVAAVLYALQILMHNKGRACLGYDILTEALSAEQSGDAGILLLNADHGDKNSIYIKLSETPDMILHSEALEELANGHDIKPVANDRRSKIGF